jgi:hypothetical protein
VVVFLLSCPGAIDAQSIVDGSGWFVRTGITPAFVVAQNPFASRGYDQADPIRHVPNLTLEVGRQTDGSESWHAMYGRPSYGFGVSLVSFQNSVDSGRPMEAYTFFSWPFHRLTDRLDLTTDFGMGLSWDWKDRNKTTDAQVCVLGSDLNARINWGFFLRAIPTSKIAVYAGADFTHRSNAATLQPDHGINVFGPKVTVQYNVAFDPPKRHTVAPPAFQPAWEFVVGGSGGVKNVIEQASPLIRSNFGAFDVTAAVQRHFYRYGKISAGIDGMYDGSTGAYLDDEDNQLRPATGQRLKVGLYGGYEQVIGSVSAIMQAGDIVARGFAKPDSRHLYARYGWRYHMSDSLWTTLAIRSTGMWQADALEIGIGYRLRRVRDTTSQ